MPILQSRRRELRRQIKRRPLPRRRDDPRTRLERLVPFLAQRHVVPAIPDEIARHRRTPNFLIIHHQQRPWRIAIDRKRPLNPRAANASQHAKKNTNPFRPQHGRGVYGRRGDRQNLFGSMHPRRFLEDIFVVPAKTANRQPFTHRPLRLERQKRMCILKTSLEDSEFKSKLLDKGKGGGIHRAGAIPLRRAIWG